MTTIDAAGRVNVAPMGPVLTSPERMRSPGGDPGFLLRPYQGSTTCANLLSSRRAVVHVTDDVLLFAKTAVSAATEAEALVKKSESGDFAMLKDCHRWFAIRVETIREDLPRYEMDCRLVESAIERPFFGFNRAKHAVIEAAILATRTHLMQREEIETQLHQLTPMVRKTAGRDEATAFELLMETIRRRLDSHVETDS
ncbi:MAG: DUF447 domain-containing protein [Planctomycetota bacterium]